MPDFIESLQGRDLGHLCIIARLWGIDLADQEIHSAILHLKDTLLNPSSVNEMVSSLGPEVKIALEDLSQHSGRLAWAQFSRTYGEVREMGPAKRDREQPYEQPISVVETLWYRGLVARAFFDTSAGPEEFAYIPDDLLILISPAPVPDSPHIGRQASLADYTQVFLCNEHILDHACTYLAALRVGISPPDSFITQAGEALTKEFVASVLLASGLIDESGNPLSEPVRMFLEARRGEALVQLFTAWKQSTQINELRHLPGLTKEGNWENDPAHARLAILGYLSEVAAETWWSLGSFISAIKLHDPDFQRPAGDYDSWFIRDKASGEYLRGFEYWDEVDGRLIRYTLTGPLYWLGILDLACSEAGHEVTAFRLSSWSKALLNGAAPKKIALEEQPLLARSDAHVSARRLTPRSVRYQLARFCEWEKETPDEYQYRISPASLIRAQQQGLKVSQLIAMLNKYAKAVPPSLIKALERWEKQGSEAKVEKMVVLRVTSEEILQALRKSRASRFLGEPLSPVTIAVKPGAIEKVLAALAELGYLGEIRGDID